MATPPPEAPLEVNLQGRRILICRPEPEASRLARVFEQAGAEVRLLPLVAREPLPETPEQRSTLQELDNFTHVIAVSPYAAKRLLEEADAWWPQLPVGIHWYGVGAATAAELGRHGLRPRRPSEGWTSEALLALPSLQNLEHERVLLARGEHGRELIRQTLESRGARVTVLPLYRLFCPYYPSETIDEVCNRFRPEVIVALSGETLNNLVTTDPGALPALQQALLVAPAERVAEQARQAGFGHILVPDGLADRDLVTSVASRLAPQAGHTGQQSKDARD